MKLILLTLCAAMGLSACSDDSPSRLTGDNNNAPPSQVSDGNTTTPPASGTGTVGATGNAFYNETLRLTTTSSETGEPVNIDVVGGISFQDAAPTSDTTEPESVPAS